MRVRNIVSTALKNCLAKKSTSAQIAIGMMISFVLCICIFSYIGMLEKNLSDTVGEYRSSNCIKADVQGLSAENIINGVSREYLLSAVLKTSNPFTGEEFFEICARQGVVPSMDNSVLCVDGREYGFLSNVGALYGVTDYINIVSYDRSYDMISSDESAEYLAVSGSSPVLCGKMPDREGEMLISECYAEAYNIPAEQLVGKTVSIKIISDGSEVVLIEKATVCGVLKNDFFNIASREIPEMMIYKEISDLHKCSISLYPENYADISDIYDIITRTYKAEAVLPSAYTVYEYLCDRIIFADRIMLLTALLVGASLLINTMRIIIYSFTKKLNYFGLMRALGMSDFTIAAISLTEIIIQTLAAFAAALCLSSFFMTLVFDRLSGIMGVSADRSFFLSADTVIKCVLLAVCFWVTAVFVFLLLLKRNTTAELLRGGS